MQNAKRNRSAIDMERKIFIVPLNYTHEHDLHIQANYIRTYACIWICGFVSLWICEYVNLSVRGISQRQRNHLSNDWLTNEERKKTNQWINRSIGRSIDQLINRKLEISFIRLTSSPMASQYLWGNSSTSGDGSHLWHLSTRCAVVTSFYQSTHHIRSVPSTSTVTFFPRRNCLIVNPFMFENPIMQFKILVWFIITNLIAVTLIAKPVSQSPDSLSLNTDLIQVPVDDNSQELMFSPNADPQAAPNTDFLKLSSSDPQAGEVDTALFNDDLLTLGNTSDDLFANSCDDNILRRRGNEPSSCQAPNNQKMNPDLDLLQRLGQGDNLWGLLDIPPGSQPGSETLEENAEKEKLLPPFDVACDAVFPIRLCCYGRAIEAIGPKSVPWLSSTVLFSSVARCFRCMYLAPFLLLFSGGLYELFFSFLLGAISIISISTLFKQNRFLR